MTPTRKNPHAVALGKRGGKARLEKMSAEDRSRVARLGAIAANGKRAAKTAARKKGKNGRSRKAAA